MIEGHGDDLYAYKGKIVSNFSSNILSGVDHGRLMNEIAAGGTILGSYPEPKPVSLERKLAKYLKVNDGDVMVTNGATEAIYMIAHTFQGAKSAIVTPTFSEYEDACVMFGHTMQFVGTIDELPEDVNVVWLCNPNNPTGKVYPKEDLVKRIKRNPEIIYVIDQAYADYTSCQVLSETEIIEACNVLLLGSFTKRFSVPGLRVGYMVGAEGLVGQVGRCRMPWSVSATAITGAEYLLDHAGDYPIAAQTLHQEALRLATELRKAGITVMDTDCNFMLCRLPSGTASQLKEYLALEHGILIRDASNFRGLDSSYFRVAAQTPDENDRLISAIKKWII